jgi:hypothetical protein
MPILRLDNARLVFVFSVLDIPLGAKLSRRYLLLLVSMLFFEVLFPWFEGVAHVENRYIASTKLLPRK